jgi:hypothetical protein
LALEFYRRVSARYNDTVALDEAWQAHTKAKDLWRFESHVAQSAIEDWLAEKPNLDVLFLRWLYLALVMMTE